MSSLILCQAPNPDRFLPHRLYMAPEILRYEKYDAKADLWSVGAVLFEMSVGKPPFRAQNHVDLLRKIERGEDKIKFPDEKRVEEGTDKVPTKVAPDLKALIRQLLKRNPSERMNFEDFFREATAVATGGTACNLVSAEAVSARHATAAAAARAGRSSTSIPRSPAPGATSPHTEARAAFIVTASSAAYAQPAVMPPPAPSPKPTTAPSASPPTPQIPAYGDPEPLPFARRASSTSTTPSAPGLKRPPSFAPKYVVEGSQGEQQEGVKVRDYAQERRPSAVSRTR